jgi:hypothetical protein
MTCKTVSGISGNAFLFYGSARDLTLCIVFLFRLLPSLACYEPSDTPSFLMYINYVSRTAVDLFVKATRRLRGNAIADTKVGSKLHCRKLLL